jgi:hypothetical protein
MHINFNVQDCSNTSSRSGARKALQEQTKIDIKVPCIKEVFVKIPLRWQMENIKVQNR